MSKPSTVYPDDYVPHAYKGQCTSVVWAAMPHDPNGEATYHQCPASPKVKHVHGCGCGYDWDDAQAAASKPSTPTAVEDLL